MSRGREVTVFAIVSVLVIAVLATTSFYQSYQSRGSGPTYDYEVPGYDVVAGNGTASDGRLQITIHGYYLGTGGHILFQTTQGLNGTACTATIGGSCYSYGAGVDSGQPFLIVNVTVSNTGRSDTAIGANFFMETTDGYATYENGLYAANAAFPAKYPNASLPASSGGYTSPLGGRSPAGSSS